MKGFFRILLDLIIGCSVVFLIYIWFSNKFPKYDHVFEYQHDNYTEYEVFVTDPIGVGMIAFGTSDETEGKAYVEAKDKFRTVLLAWFGMTVVVIIISGLIRKKL